jgi:hypothetical protein
VPFSADISVLVPSVLIAPAFSAISKIYSHECVSLEKMQFFGKSPRRIVIRKQAFLQNKGKEGFPSAVAESNGADALTTLGSRI